MTTVASSGPSARGIVTLLPAATEIVTALGGIDDLVGISHECDYPEAVRGLPRVTATPIDPSLPGARIDIEVRRLQMEGRPVIGIDAALLRQLAPDLVVTQGLCEVCAMADGEVHRLAALLDPAPRVVSLSATSIEGIWRDISTIGEALGRSKEAEHLVRRLRGRLDRLRQRARSDRSAARAVCIEWLDPLYLAGHWVPELVAAAGAVDVGAEAGSHSTRHSWEAVAALEPDLILIMLCGFGVERARQELAALSHPLGQAFLRSAPVWIVDANAYTSRPGPRIVEGAERIGAALDGRELPGLARWTPEGECQ